MDLAGRRCEVTWMLYQPHRHKKYDSPLSSRLPPSFFPDRINANLQLGHTDEASIVADWRYSTY